MREEIFSVASEIDDETVAQTVWLEVEQALLKSRSSMPLDAGLALAQVAFQLAKHGAREGAIKLLEQVEQVQVELKNSIELRRWVVNDPDPALRAVMPLTIDKKTLNAFRESTDLKVRIYRVLALRALNHQQASSALYGLIKGLMHEANGKSIVEAIALLTASDDNILDDKTAFQGLLELCAGLRDLDNRSEALQAIMEAAVESGDLVTAASLLIRMPLSSQLDKAVEYVARQTNADLQLNSSDRDTIWREIIYAAGQSVEALRACATAWAQHYVTSTSSSAKAEEAFQALLGEVDFVASGVAPK
jgi:hypothetical protein